MRLSEKILNDKKIKNAGWLISSRVLRMLIGLIIGMISARYLGPSNYGLIGYANAYIAFFSSVATLGINSVIIKELIHKKGRENEVMGTALALRLLAGLLSSLAIIGIVSILDRERPLAIAVGTLMSLCSVLSAFEIFDLFFKSRLESRVCAVSMLSGYIISALYKLFLVITCKSVLLFALTGAVEICISSFIFIFLYFKKNGAGLRFSKKYAYELLRASTPFVFPALMVAVYSQFDKLILMQTGGESETGFFTSASAIALMCGFILQAVIDSFNPEITSLYKEGRSKEFTNGCKKMYGIVIYLSLAISLMTFIFAKPAVLLLYGSDYLPAVPVLRILAFSLPFSYMGVARNVWIVNLGRQRYLKSVYLFCACASLLLDIILIKSCGAVGAAIAFSLTQVFTVICAAFIPPLRESLWHMAGSLCFFKRK